MLIPYDLRTNHRVDPLGIDTPTPGLSWRLRGRGRGRRQTAYRIRVRDASRDPEASLVWDSGPVEHSSGPIVEYGGPPLTSRQQLRWTVAVRDNRGAWSPESPPAFWEMGLLDPGEWNARWIGAPAPPPARPLPMEAPEKARILTPLPFFRTVLTLSARPVQARLYATALGVYQPYVNGRRAGSVHLAPGWTDYRRRVRYQVYDLSGLLDAGPNTVGFILGEGWYAGYLGFGGGRALFGSVPMIMARLEATLPDGTVQSLVTDDTWTTRSGPILYSDMLMGEAYDARLEIDRWCHPDAPDDGWTAAVVQDPPHILVSADRDPGVVVREGMPPAQAWQSAPDTWIYDFGRNLVGFCSLTLSGSRGASVRLRFAEVLDESGALYTANYRGAACEDHYVLKGGDPEVFRPRFTYRGFRFMEVTLDPTLVAHRDVAAHVVESDLPEAGTLVTGHPLVNRLQQNILTSLRGNLVAVPTDCPQRDERLGWLGDALVFGRTAAYNRDVAAFLGGWLETVRDAQSSEGGFPDVAPRIVDDSDGAPAWGDAGVFLPWALYEMYGDRQLLQENYAAMQAWVAYIRRANPDGVWRHRRNHDFGDWIAVDPTTPKDLLATAFYAEDVRIMREAAAVLGRTQDRDEYARLWHDVRGAFQREFLDGDGLLKAPTQTAAALVLHMDLAPEPARGPIADRLVADIAARGGHLSTGFAGTEILCPVLSEAGYDHVAHALLVETGYPSWGYMIQHGATSMWERWDGWTPEAGFQDPGMNSFNHYALGSVGAWLYGYVAGIRPDRSHPGMESLVIAPHPHPALGWARASYRAPRGTVRVAWSLRAGDGAFRLSVTLPPSTTATVVIPKGSGQHVRERGRSLDTVGSIAVVDEDYGAVTCIIGSGTYRFSAEGRRSTDRSG